MIICQLSFSPIPDDARVRRHGDALAAAGHRVIGVGLPGGRATPPRWEVRTIGDGPPPRLPRPIRILGMGLCRVVPALAESVYWSMPHHHAMVAAAADIDADLFVANDWLTLPIAAHLASQRGCRFLYDSHEYAAEESADRLAWRLLISPYVRAIEARFIHRAAAILTVGDKIAQLIAHDHRLATMPTVIRNAVPLDPQPFRPCGAEIDVLYQGLIRADRGLEALIRSVPLWRPEFRLRLRGPGDPSIITGLQATAAALAPERITFEAAVDPASMVAAANRSDIGIHPIPPTSNQTRYCLPNKFFEYTMAGLALCVSNSDEMVALLHRHHLGRVIAVHTPEAIAAAINGFDRPMIDDAKRQAVMAAATLCWEQEQDRLLAVFHHLTETA